MCCSELDIWICDPENLIVGLDKVERDILLHIVRQSVDVGLVGLGENESSKSLTHRSHSFLLYAANLKHFTVE